MSDLIALLRALATTPGKFDFYQAVRLLECHYRDKPRLGRAPRAADDPVRFRQPPHLQFPPTTLASFQAGDDDRKAELAVYFFGVFGPNGPLPLHLTEYARNRIRHHRDPTLAHFADVFHHRLLSLFYRAWADARPAVNFDRPGDDRFARYTGALSGFSEPSMAGRDALPDDARRYYTGHFSHLTRNAEGLKAMVADFFGVPVTIDQFIGEWLAIPDHYCWRLGDSPDNSTLGATATLGGGAWSCQSKFRIVAGPLSKDQFLDFLPGSDALKQLTALVKNYAGPTLNWELKLVVENAQKPAVKLGESGRLGWTSWLADAGAGQQDGEFILTPQTIEHSDAA